MSKKTYNKLGLEAQYQYEQQDVEKYKKMIVSNTISSLNVVNGNNNYIKDMIYSIDNIGSNIEELYPSCFYNCENLRYVNLGKNIKVIGDEAFKDCLNLSSFDNDIFYVPQELKEKVFYNCNFSKIVFKNNNYEHIEEDELIKNQILLGGNIFSNNTQLTGVEMDDILLGNNMFNNCNKLQSVTINEGAETIYCDSSPFLNCGNLTSLTFPKSISSYYMLHNETLKGSNIDKLYLNGMTSTDVMYAIGQIEEQRVIFKPPTDTEDIKLGTIYKFDNDENDSMQGIVDNFISKIVNGHIPAFIIRCGDQCGRCRDFYNGIIGNSSFVEWFKSQKCIIVYLNGKFINGKGTVSLNPTNDFQFIYNNSFGEQVACKIGGSILRIVDSVSKAKNIRKKIIYERDKYSIYLRSSRKNENGEYDFNKNTPVYGLNFGYYSEPGMYPIMTWMWISNTDLMIRESLCPIINDNLSKFQNNEDFDLVIKCTCGKKKFIHFRKNATKKNYSPRIFNLNGKNITYYITYNDQGSDEKESENNKIYVSDTNIYFMNGSKMVPENAEWVNYSAGGDIIIPSLSKFQKIVTSFCNGPFNNINYIPQNTDEIKTEKIVGNCWGLQKNCKVYDKDGKEYQFIYKPPT